MTITVTSIQNFSLSSDGSEVTINFAAKYLNQYSLKMNLDHLPEVIASLINIGKQARLPQRSYVDSPEPSDHPGEPLSDRNAASYSGANPRTVFLPKSFAVEADLREKQVVLLSFGVQPQLQPIKLGLHPQVATSLAKALIKTAARVTNAEEAFDPR